MQPIGTDLVTLPESAGGTVGELKKKKSKERNPVDLGRPKPG